MAGTTSRILYLATVLDESDWSGFLDAKFAMLKKEWEAAHHRHGDDNEQGTGSANGSFCMIGITPTATFCGTESEPLKPVPPTLSEEDWKSGTKTVFRTSPTREVLHKRPPCMVDVVLLRRLIATFYVEGETHLVIGTHGLGDTFKWDDVLVENSEVPDHQYVVHQTLENDDDDETNTDVSPLPPSGFQFQVKDRNQYPTEEFFKDLFSGHIENNNKDDEGVSPGPAASVKKDLTFITVTLDSCLMAELHTIAAVWRQLQAPYLVASQGWMWVEDEDVDQSIFSPTAARSLWSITKGDVQCRSSTVEAKLTEVVRAYCEGSDNPADCAVYNTKTAETLLTRLSTEVVRNHRDQQRRWCEWQQDAEHRFYGYLYGKATRLRQPQWIAHTERNLQRLSRNSTTTFTAHGWSNDHLSSSLEPFIDGCALIPTHQPHHGNTTTSSSTWTGDYVEKVLVEKKMEESQELHPKFNFYANPDDTGLHAGWLVEGHAALSELFSTPRGTTRESNNDDDGEKRRTGDDVLHLSEQMVVFRLNPNKRSTYVDKMQPSSFSISLRRNIFNVSDAVNSIDTNGSVASRCYAFVPDELH